MYRNWILIILVIFLPIISIESKYVNFHLDSYKFSFVLLLIYFFVNARARIDRQLFVWYLSLTTLLMLLSLYSIYDVYSNYSILREVSNRTIIHIIGQAVLFLVFFSLLVFLVSAKNDKVIFVLMVRYYIYSLVLASLVSIILLALEVSGIELLSSSINMNIYKLQGVYGEPKQFASAMLSGVVLLSISAKDNEAIFRKSTNTTISIFLFMSGLASFSSSYLLSVLAAFVLYFVLKIISINKLASIAAMLLLSLPYLIAFNHNSHNSITPGALSVFDKVSSIDSAIAYAPKDGSVFADLFDRPENYIIGGGAGSFYKNIVTDNFLDRDRLHKISIIRSIYEDPLSSAKQGPSTIQGILLSDYGFLGIFIFIMMLQRSEKIILGGVSARYGVLYFFLFFVTSFYYFMFLVFIHLSALKARGITKH